MLLRFLGRYNYPFVTNSIFLWTTKLIPGNRVFCNRYYTTRMPQKSIGSFFTKKPKDENKCVTISNKENDKISSPATGFKSEDGSPLKAAKKSKKRRIEDSDDEEEDSADVRPSVSVKSNLSSSSLKSGRSDDEGNHSDSVKENGDSSPPPKRKTARKSVVGPSKKARISSQTDTDEQQPSTSTSPGDNTVEPDVPKENTATTPSESISSSPMKCPSKSPIKNSTTPMKTETPSSSVKTENSKSSEKKKSASGANPATPTKVETPTKSAVTMETSKSSEKKKSAQGMNSFFTKKTDSGKSIGKGKGDKSSTKQESYNPGKANYHPIHDACWAKGEKVPYLALARTFEEIEAISARLKLTSILCNFLRSVIVLSPDELLPCIYLCLNKLAPAYEGVELGIGEHLLMKAVCLATGKNIKEIKAQLGEKGDLGIVAESCKSNQRVMFAPPPLTVSNVFKRLKEIALMTGHASMGKKQEKIQGMFVACKHSEARYLMRSLGGKLRIGLAEQSVLTALGHAVVLTPPGQDYPPKVLNVSSVLSDEIKKEMADAALAIKTAYCELPTYNVIVKNLLETGWEKLPETCHITPGIPLKPMLAHPTKGIGEVLKRFDNAEFTCEYKYDGERAQIHLQESGEVNIYSRNQENNTTKYPDIISRIPNVVEEHVKSFIIDTESVAWDTEKKQILPFQVLTTRKRKDVDSKDITVQVCVYAFDILYLNGESLVRKPFRKRRELLKLAFKEVEGEFVFATSKSSGDTDEISQFLEESIQGNCEGLMVKTLDTDATYEIAKRSHNWLKLKKDYLEGVGDTLDLVVIGGYLGTGKRTGKYGGFLLACYDEENEEYQSICKTGTGFTDEQLTKHYEFLKDQVIDKPRSYYNCGDIPAPDHWFNAVQVWEIRAADLSISPIYKAGVGIVDPDKGISLRFPRFLRIRDDKKPDEATNSQQVADFYNSQQQIQNANEEKSKGDAEEAFY